MILVLELALVLAFSHINISSRLTSKGAKSTYKGSLPFPPSFPFIPHLQTDRNTVDSAEGHLGLNCKHLYSTALLSLLW